MERQKFSSQFASTLTFIGVAVGLGNVWRFPYMMGEYGGSAFLIVYLLFTIFLAIPGLTAEWTLGRATRKGPIGALSSVLGKTWGRRIGGLIVFTMIVSTSYYLVVIGNIAFSASFSVFNGFSESTIPGIQRADVERLATVRVWAGGSRICNVGSVSGRQQRYRSS